MNQHILTGSDVATKRATLSITELVAEYEAKRAALPEAVAAFEAATTALKSAATLRGTWGQVPIDPRAPYESTLADALLKSAWRHVYEVGGFERIASADDKRRFEQMFAKPPPLPRKTSGRPSNNTATRVRRSFGAWPRCSASSIPLSKATRR